MDFPQITTWFTADLHLGHENIIHYCGRPFSSVLEMDDALIANINALVKPHEHLYILGDFCFGRPEPYIERINCQYVTLVRGNHDKNYSLKVYQDCFWRVDDGIVDCAIMQQPIVLCHHPLESWTCIFETETEPWHLHGHVHGRLMPMVNRLDVGVDAQGYKPIAFPQIWEIMTSTLWDITPTWR